MYSLALLLLVVQAWDLAGTVSHQSNHEQDSNTVDTDSLTMFRGNNSSREHRLVLSFQTSATPQDNKRFNFPRTRTPDQLWKLEHDSQNKVETDSILLDTHLKSFTRPENVKHVYKRSPRNKQREKRATSKFTGLVVGATKDNALKQSVMKTLNHVEAVIWSIQSQYSKPFIGSSLGNAVIMGTFNSELRTNFHGYKQEVQLRQSKDYTLQDLNSLATLLILQCLTEASLYGSAATPAASNMSIAIESLKAFYTHTYPRGSSILTMWPEKLLPDGKGWLNIPENIVGAQVKGNTTYSQLDQLAKSCNCEPARSGAKEMLENKLCREHFAKPLSDFFKDAATPPDFMTSFSNLALGSLLQIKTPARNVGAYKAESELWQSANSDPSTLTNKLKSLAIVFSVKLLETSNNSSKESGKNVTSGETKKMNATSVGVSLVDNSSENVTAGLFGNINTSVGTQNGTNITSAGPDVSQDNVKGNTVSSSVASTNIVSSSGDNNNVSVNGGGHPDSPNVHNRTSRSVLESPSNQILRNGSEYEGRIGPLTRSIPEANVSTPSTVTNVIVVSTAEPLSTSITPNASTATSTVDILTTAVPATATPAVPATATPAAKPTPLTKPSLDANHVNQIISSESYYALRNFLHETLVLGKHDAILIPSWISDEGYTLPKVVAPPNNEGNVWHNGKLFNAYNSVNLMTTATTLHALIVANMAGLLDVQGDVMIQRIVVSSLRLLTYYMSNHQEAATMVVLSAFPSRYQLYWVVSRIAFQLNSKRAQATLMFQFADKVIQPFMTVLRDKMTFSILQSITDAGLGQDGKTRVYIDDFIGVADLDDRGNKLVSGDDRLFTSAMGLSALISTWTVQLDNGILEFVKGPGPYHVQTNDGHPLMGYQLLLATVCPLFGSVNSWNSAVELQAALEIDIGDPVRIAVNSLANYISGAVNEQAVSNLNAFMSDQVKNCRTIPALYPANIITSATGSTVSPTEPNLQHRFGVQGHMSTEAYQKLLETPRFGYTTPGGTLDDLNSPSSVFRFWSSPAFTKAAAFLAIAQAANLQIEDSS